MGGYDFLRSKTLVRFSPPNSDNLFNFVLSRVKFVVIFFIGKYFTKFSVISIYLTTLLSNLAFDQISLIFFDDSESNKTIL